MKKRLISLLLVVLMLVSLMPIPAFAAEKITATTVNSNTADGVFMQKTSAYDPATGNMDISIEAYTTGTVQSSIRTVPTDIVLVLDVSGSMQGNGMSSMTTAVNNFISATKTQNDSVTNAADKHSIAIIKFANNSFPGRGKMTVGNEKNGSGYNHTQIIADFTTVDAAGVTTLQGAVNALSASGPTAVDYGLDLAAAILDERAAADNGAYSERNKVVIVFADGEPNYYSGYNAEVAYKAMNYAAVLKDSGTKVFTIGTFSGANSSDTSSDANKFMNYLSSNYPDAHGSTESWNFGFGSYTAYNINPGEQPYYNTYYHAASNANLNSVFQSISSSIGVPQIELGEQATIVDVVSDYFDISYVGSDPAISVYTSDYKGGDNFNDPDKWTAPVAATGVTTALDADGDTVTVKGFDYDTNYVSATARDGNFYGKKLILKISSKPDYAAIDAATEAGKLAGGIIPTNESASLQASDQNTAAYVTAPTLQANTVTYKVITGDNETVTHTYYRFPGGEKELIDKPADTAEHSYGDWDTDDATIEDGSITMPSTDVEFVSVAEVKKYNISFEYSSNVPAGASALPASMRNIPVGELVKLPEITAPEGYAFTGWTEAGGDATGTSFNMPAQDLHFTGGFLAQPAAFKVEHYLENPNGGYPDTPAQENVLSLSANTDTVVTARLATHHGFSYDEAATRENQQAGVSLPTSAGDDMPSGTVKADGSLVLRLYYKRNTHTITYVYDGTVPAAAPAVPAGGTYRYGQEVTIAARPQVAGYTFNGWAVHSGETSTTVSTVTMRDADLVLHGSFTANSGTAYTVEHYFETTGSTDAGNKANYELAESRTEIKSATTDTTVEAEAISDILGFKYEEDLSTAEGVVAGDGSLVLKLYYSRTRHTVTYQYRSSVPADASPLPEVITYKYGDTVTVALAATATGYDFSGWQISNAPAPASFAMPAADVNIYGQFSPAANKYIVEHYLMNTDGTWPNSTDHIHEYDDVKTGATVTAVLTEHSGFTYDEAKTTASGSQAEGVSFVTVDGKQVPQASVKADGTTVLKLYYARNKYSITYVFEGQTRPEGLNPPVDGNSYFFEEIVRLKDRPIAAGYTFHGWSIHTGATSISSDNTMKMPAADVTLHGSFTANSGTQYKVEHYFENSASTDKNNAANYERNDAYTVVADGTTDTTATAAIRSDIGFQYEAELSTVSGNIAGDGSLVLKVYYSRARHNVSYYYRSSAPGASALPATVTYKYGDTVTVAGAASAPGYNFSGWQINNAPAPASFTMPAAEMSIYGQFTPAANKYTVYVYEMDTTGNYPATTDHVHVYEDVFTGDTATATISAITGLSYDEAKTMASGSQSAGVTFVTDAAGNQVPTASVKADGSTVLKLYFKRNQYTVSYEYFGDNIPTHVSPACDSDLKISAEGYGGTYYYGQEVVIAPNATDGDNGENFSFSGWSIRTGNTSIKDGKMLMPNSDVVLRGSFTATGTTPYIVEHYFQNLNDDEYTINNELTETRQGAANSSTTAMPLSGDELVGFTFNAEKSAITRTGLITDTPTLVLKLYYDRTVHTVTYQYTGHVPASARPGFTVVDGAQIIGSYTEEYRFGASVQVKPGAEADGYAFSEWTPRTRLTIDGSGYFEMPASDVVFTGHFTAQPNRYKVEHYLMGLDGQYPATTDDFYYVNDAVTDQQVSLDTNVPHTGFTFDAETTGEQYKGIVAADGSTVLKLYFKRDRYTVSYQYDGEVPAGAVPSYTTVDGEKLITGYSSTYYFEEMVRIRDNAVAPGYIFTGWAIHTGDTSIEAGYMKMPDHGVILHGSFNADPDTPYTVEHYWENVDSTDHSNAANYTRFAIENLSGTTGTSAFAEPISDSRVLGFSYNETLSAPSVEGVIAADGSLVLKLYYKRMDTVIKYQFTGSVPAGAVLPADVNSTYGATVNVAAAPSLQGYSFHGWYNELDIPAGAGESFTVPAVAEIIFSGRFTANPNKYKVEHYLMDTAGNYPAEADHFYEITNVTTGQAVSVSTALDHVGFAFDSAAPNVLTGTVAPDGSTVLKLYFKRNQFSVSYQYDGAVPEGASALPVDSTLYYFEQEVTVAPNATAAGYIFTGWSIHTGDTVILGNKMAMPNSNVVLYGAFNADPNTPYTVEHYLELLDDTPDTVDYPAVPDRSVVKSGKTGTPVYAEPLSDASLLGFDYDTDSVAEGTIAADGSLVIKLYYKRTVEPVVYEYVGVVPAGAPSVPAAESYKYGTNVSVAADPVLSGYTFSGWEPWDSTAVSISNGAFSMPERPVYFHGSFSANPSAYTVNYFLQNPDGSYPAEPTSSDAFNVGVNVDDVVTAVPANSYRTYSYDEARTTASGSQSAGVSFTTVNGLQVPQGTVNAEGTLSLNLYYSRNTYDLSYKFTGTVPAGAVAPDAQTGIRHGATIALATATVPAGYSFDGWYHDTVKLGDSLSMPAADTVLTGSFSARTDVQYSVKYYLEKLDGGYELKQSQVHTGTTGSYVVGSRIDFTGFTFNMEKSEWNGHVKGDGSLVLELYYDRNVHTVSYHYIGETPADVVLPAAKEYKYGESFTVAPGLDAVAPDVFRGWYTPSVSGISSSTENAEGTVMTMPDHNVVFYGACFSYSVSYDLAGGTLEGADTVASREVAWDEAALLPVGTPEKEGHDFLGWIYLETPVTDSHKYSDLALNYTVVNIVLVANYAVEEPVLPPAPTTGTAKLVKVDAADSATVLSGAVFQLYNSDNTLVGSYTTDAKGEINVPDMEPGAYYWLEALPAEGYTVDKARHEFTVTAGGTAVSTVSNTRTAVPEVFTGEHYAYVIGYEDGMVHPERNITRAEVATIFFRLLNDDVRAQYATKENPFSDVNESDWFNLAVSTMYNLGILNGYEDNSFRPAESITRAEFAAIAARFDADGDASDTIFKDIYEHWGRREINIAANNGWVLGYEDGVFKPDELITRAEAMTMVNRVLQRIPQSAADLLSNMKTWPDNPDSGKWYYMAIQEATNSHDYIRKDNGYEFWTALREGRDWKEIEA